MITHALQFFNTYKAKDVPGDMETILSLVGQACLLRETYFFLKVFFYGSS